MYEETIRVLENEINRIKNVDPKDWIYEKSFKRSTGIKELESAIKLLQKEGKNDIDYGVNNPNDPTKYGRKDNNE